MAHYERRDAARLRRQKLATALVIALALAVLAAIAYTLVP